MLHWHIIAILQQIHVCNLVLDPQRCLSLPQAIGNTTCPHSPHRPFVVARLAGQGTIHPLVPIGLGS